MPNDFKQIDWNSQTEDDCRQLIRLAIREDLRRGQDWTTVTLVNDEAQGKAAVVCREQAVVAGLPAAELVLAEMDPALRWTAQVSDGDQVKPDATLAVIEGPARSLLTAERIVLNLLGRLTGIATLTRTYVDAIAGTSAAIYDTRKTTPGWRLLEKYAVRQGGGRNHRTGLYDAVLIKDNHLALGGQAEGRTAFSPAEAVGRARERLLEMRPAAISAAEADAMVFEIEVDTLEQLRQVLPVAPDVVLLDNMSCEQLQQAVECRDSIAPDVQLEASGGVSLQTVRRIAETGVDRISVGALTHSAKSCDVALDWC